jgi:hypothetical protein
LSLSVVIVTAHHRSKLFLEHALSHIRSI